MQTSVDVDWLRIIRVLTQYVAPALVIAALLAEFVGALFASLPFSTAYSYLVAVVFSLLTFVMIGLCGWIVFLWDIDRLFFSLERKIDTQFDGDTAAGDAPRWVAAQPR